MKVKNEYTSKELQVQKSLEQRDKDREVYIAQFVKQCELLDKAILTISAASFNFALIFIGNMSTVDDLKYKIFFISGLTFLALSIISTLISFFLSKKNAMYCILKTDEFIRAGISEPPEMAPPYEKLLNRCNKGSLIFVILGLSFIIGYIACNL